MRLSVSPFSSHTTLNLFPAVGYSGYWANSPEITSHHIPSLPRHFSISKIWRHLRWFSLWVLPRWYLMNWCAGDVADRAGDCTMVWISPAFFPLVPYFSLSSPSHLTLSCSLFTPFSFLHLLPLWHSPCPLSRRCWSWPSPSSMSRTSI